MLRVLVLPTLLFVSANKIVIDPPGFWVDSDEYPLGEKTGFMIV